MNYWDFFIIIKDVKVCPEILELDYFLWNNDYYGLGLFLRELFWEIVVILDIKDLKDMWLTHFEKAILPINKNDELSFLWQRFYDSFWC